MLSAEYSGRRVPHSMSPLLLLLLLLLLLIDASHRHLFITSVVAVNRSRFLGCRGVCHGDAVIPVALPATSGGTVEYDAQSLAVE
jgi:hypothetical protein